MVPKSRQQFKVDIDIKNVKTIGGILMSEKTGEIKGKAKEMKGEIKGKAKEMEGELKGKTKEAEGKIKGKISSRK